MPPELPSPRRAGKGAAVADFDFSILEDGALEVRVLTDAGRDLLRDLLSKPRGDDEGFANIIEHMGWAGNGRLYTVAAEWIGALTNGPILADQLDPPVVPDGANVWWFPNYQISDPLEVLLELGRVVFTKAPTMPEAPLVVPPAPPIVSTVKTVDMGSGMRVEITKEEGTSEKYGPYTWHEAYLQSEDSSRLRISSSSDLSYVEMDVELVRKSLAWAVELLRSRVTDALTKPRAPRRKKKG